MEREKETGGGELHVDGKEDSSLKKTEETTHYQLDEIIPSCIVDNFGNPFSESDYFIYTGLWLRQVVCRVCLIHMYQKTSGFGENCCEP